ncbi:general odorant-binding protein 70 isoform X2 [Homalodisca vitripennis]|uniref:general odorant-binding protein 70 isoform X2 n=1 Tax=Homalodisca vitripennis TaxID=197043 RepID=UPI001EEBDCA0|nr:general odorant-binding protein 70 isoform X2 [Homalodisca vitripennis]
MLATALLLTLALSAAASAQLEQQLQQQSQQQQSQQQRQSQQQKQQDVKEQLPLCVPPATAPAKLEAVIEQCQDEIKQAVLEEALQVLGDASRELELASNTRSKRETFTSEERRIAGCLLQCVYRKVKAVDENGLPTVSGLVHLYSDGVSDRNYFLATLQAVHQCMTLANNRRAFNTQVEEDAGYTCDLAYDMFNCVSERIESICGRAP